MESKVLSSGRILFVDPNQSNQHMITPDNLSISVELRTFKKDRRAIEISRTADGKRKLNVDSGTQRVPITFIGGSDLGNKRSLTTHYTELNTNFNSGNKDLETLGIKDIQIEFNTALAPLVTITFTDVRGKLFEMGKDSPYSVFFELPYPIFELTIKGFYGKAVKYNLHLTKFNGRFDYSSGTFEINTEFIGYTYGFMTDIIMGYLKGIPYTELGKAKVLEKEAENVNGDVFLTFDELNDIGRSINDKIIKFKDNKQITAIAKGQDLIEELDNFRTQLITSVNFLAENKGNQLQPLKNAISACRSSNSANDNFSQYENSVKVELEKLNKLLGGYKLSTNLYNLVEGETILRRIVKNDFKGDTIESYITATNNTGRQISKIATNQEYYFSVKTYLQSLSGLADNAEVTIFDLRPALNEINEKVRLIKNDSKNTIKIAARDFFDEITKSFGPANKTFDPTIRNFFKILSDHVDIFLDCIRDVAIEAESDAQSISRYEQLKKVINNVETVDAAEVSELKRVKAFPDYKEKEEDFNGMVDKWIGNVAPDMPEVRFVEELLEGIITAAQRDKEYQTDIETGGVRWFPVNPLDGPLFTTKNPYELLSDSGRASDYIRLMALRAILFMSVTNRDVTNDEILNMAEIEANNMFESIKNNQIKLELSNLNTNGTPTDIAAKVSNQIRGIERNEEFKNYAYPINNYGILNKNTAGQDYYNYVPHLAPDFTKSPKNIEYLPITVVNDDYKNYNGDFLVKESNTLLTNEERVSLRDENNVVFISNIAGGGMVSGNDKPDDGSTLFKIMTTTEFVNKNVGVYPSYGDDIYGANKLTNFNEPIDSRELFYADTPIDMPILAGIRPTLGTTEYDFVVSSNGTVSPTPNRARISVLDSIRNKEIFYSSRTLLGKTSQILAQDTDLKTQSAPFLGFKVRTSLSLGPINFNPPYYYSLFGSDLYYSQNADTPLKVQKAKAYLFLHSLPFDGMTLKTAEEGLQGLMKNNASKVLANKAGIHRLPYAWVLFMGAIIARNDNEFTVNFTNGNFNLLPFFELNETVPTRSQYCLSEVDGDVMTFKAGEDFTNVEDIITKLPVSVKNEFKREFNAWADLSNPVGFNKIKNEGEIFVEGTPSTERYNLWRIFNQELVNNPTALYNRPILNPKLLKNYSIVNRENAIGFQDRNTYTLAQSINAVATLNNGSPFYFYLEARDGSDLVKTILDFLKEERTIMNATWRTWYQAETVVSGNHYDIQVANLDTYVKNFFENFVNLTRNSRKLLDSRNEIKEELFQTLDSDDIKLKIYKTIKSIYDKWICGSEEKYLDIVNTSFIDTFRFIDRSYNDISDKFKVNPIPMIDYLNNNYNQSIHSYISRILTDNNFDFHPLPSYINYNDIEEIKNVFRPYSYNELVDNTVVGPQFVCMYIGERSNKLDVGENFKNDGIDFIVDANGLTTKGECDDFMTQSTNATRNDKVPVFLVEYGDDNQSIFRDIQLNQSEFTATDESLSAIANIADSVGVGQNLFDVYNTRSYTAHVEMLGNAMIQPFMYFQLNGIPLFHGAYTIIKVRHSIKPNSMTTTFSGVRIRGVKTKMVDEETIFINIFKQLGDIITDGASLDDLYSDKESAVIRRSRNEVPNTVAINSLKEQIKETEFVKSRDTRFTRYE